MKIYYTEVIIAALLLAAFSRITYVFKFSSSLEEVEQDPLNKVLIVVTFALAVWSLLREAIQLIAMARIKLAKTYVGERAKRASRSNTRRGNHTAFSNTP